MIHAHCAAGKRCKADKKDTTSWPLPSSPLVLPGGSPHRDMSDQLALLWAPSPLPLSAAQSLHDRFAHWSQVPGGGPRQVRLRWGEAPGLPSGSSMATGAQPGWMGIGFFLEPPAWSPAGNPVILACRTKQRDRLLCKTRGGKWCCLVLPCHGHLLWLPGNQGIDTRPAVCFATAPANPHSFPFFCC